MYDSGNLALHIKWLPTYQFIYLFLYIFLWGGVYSGLFLLLQAKKYIYNLLW